MTKRRFVQSLSHLISPHLSQRDMWPNLMDMDLRKTFAVFSKCRLKTDEKRCSKLWQVYFRRGCLSSRRCLSSPSLFESFALLRVRSLPRLALISACKPLHFFTFLNLISQQFPKSLIILKNIWMSSPIHACCSMSWPVIAIKVFPLQFCKIYLFRIT